MAKPAPRSVQTCTTSNWHLHCRVLETVAEGTAALVEWKLQTGRTHQIRVHAQHIGCPLFGDQPYEGVHRAISKVARGNKQRYAPSAELSENRGSSNVNPKRECLWVCMRSIRYAQHYLQTIELLKACTAPRWTTLVYLAYASSTCVYIRSCDCLPRFLHI